MSLPAGIKRVSVYDLLGREIEHIHDPGEFQTFFLQGYPTGTYLLQADQGPAVRLQVVK
jgi:hypothetical protein